MKKKEEEEGQDMMINHSYVETYLWGIWKKVIDAVTALNTMLRWRKWNNIAS